MEYTFGGSCLPTFAVRTLALSITERSVPKKIEVGAFSVVHASTPLWCACIDAIDRSGDLQSGLARYVYCSYIPLDDFLRTSSCIEDGVVMIGVDQKSTDRFGRLLFENIKTLFDRELLHVIPVFESESLMEKFLEYCFPVLPICMLGEPTDDDLDLLISALVLRDIGHIMELDPNVCVRVRDEVKFEKVVFG